MSPKVSRKNGNFNTKSRTRNIIHKRLKAVLNSRVCWHLECHHVIGLFSLQFTLQAQGNGTSSLSMLSKRRQHNGSGTHFQALVSLSGNTGAENHREREEEIGYHISNSDLRTRGNLEERLLQLQLG